MCHGEYLIFPYLIFVIEKKTKNVVFLEIVENDQNSK